METIQKLNADKLSKFLLDIENTDGAKQMAEFFNKEMRYIVYNLRKFITVSKYRDGNIKEIEIDLLEKESNIRTKLKSKFEKA